MLFPGFSGNTQIKERIAALMDSGRMPHALILEGPRGIGKRTLANIIAAAMVCTGEGEHPCGSCGGCLRARNAGHPDIITASGSGKTGAISVDSIRFIKDDAYVVPSEADRKVYILPDADKTLPAAQNAFLKVFEEPPARAMFIITCVSSLSLLETIRSRAVILRLKELSEQDAVAAVSDKTQVSHEEILKAFQVFGGNAGLLIESLSDGKFSGYIATASAIASALLSPNELDIVLASAPIDGDREAFVSVLTLLSLIFRDSLAVKAGAGTLLSGNAACAGELAKRLTEGRLLSLYGICLELIDGNKSYVNASLLTVRLCSALRTAAGAK